ncbi:hypothetical protein GJR96_06575 [Haloferax sp. MBLA0076]|uniref:Uncharacterized protein n=1 Tax=Haloferax litoreum TaxID=2666140 RepID=A0A6A8GFC9_9EURY|nr:MULTISPECIES: DUF5787 family protein [Haloferax]KAB1193124.1 hypothetical protein Hfx1148_06565 [Haloferax sp. CBA1148]MRX21619.1 hypothetical protein [Haloferax litoreum]
MPTPVSSPSEFAFELALCAHLEEVTDWLPARQLGASVASPGSRIIDVCAVVPGPEFDDRSRITSRDIPATAIESEVGVGHAVFWRDAFDCHPARARRATDRAVEAGFFESEHRRGREYVRRATRYPDEWFSRLVGIENKPDLGEPGDLLRQLRLDVSLALFDEVVLATESYVTGAHLNRIPEEVGVWRFDPETGEREIVRDADPLATDATGVEPVEYESLHTDVALVSPADKRTARLRLAERAYGKGWRGYDVPGCASAGVDAVGRPVCSHFGRVVDPGAECGSNCPAFGPADPPELDRGALRDARTGWVADPDGVARRQSGLDRFW